jgi:hypothetical protein
MFMHVTSVQVLHDYVLQLQFSDGGTKVVDLSAELHGEVFEPLRDVKLFNRVFVNADTGTIEWPNGADFAPEYLFSHGKDLALVA